MTWVQPKTQAELMSRLADAVMLKVSERERENLCACALTEIRRLSTAARQFLSEWDDLIGESNGVCGLHLNGDDAPWDEIVEDGRYERIFPERLRMVLK